MKLSFYPGCSLEGLAIDYARSIDAVFQALDIDLVEIDPGRSYRCVLGLEQVAKKYRRM